MKKVLAILTLAVAGVALGTVCLAGLAVAESPPLDCEAREPVPETYSWFYKKHASDKNGKVGAYYGFQGGVPSEGPYTEPQAGFTYGGEWRTVGVPFKIGNDYYIIVEHKVGNGDGQPGNVPPDECFPPETTEPPTTEPPVTEPPSTEPPATTPPVTDPPSTDPPVTTEPVVTDPPATSPPTTEPTVSVGTAPVPPTAPPPSPPQAPVTELPATGSETTLALLAGLLTLAGGGAVVAARRRS